MGRSQAPFLKAETLAHWCGLIDLPREATLALQEMAEGVAAEPALILAFCEFHESTVVRGKWHREWSPLPVSPTVQELLGEDTSLFYLLAYLSALPSTWQKYRRLGVGEDVFRASMLDFRLHVENFHRKQGRWGFASFDWIWRHVTAELFRLGRLQFMLVPFPEGVTAFRRRADSQVLLLADPELILASDGAAWGAGRSPGTDIPAPDESAWKPAFKATKDGWRGHPVNSPGRVEREPVFLRRSEWAPVLRRGDTVLDVHIPRDDPFDPDSCRSSYGQAVEFFARVFPKRPFKAFRCHTWIFTPQLSEILPPSSNLLKFQRDFALYPNPGTRRFLFQFVFGGNEDLSTAPRGTSLQRGVLDWIASGGVLYDLAGVRFQAPDPGNDPIR